MTEPRTWLLDDMTTALSHGACHLFAAKLYEIFGYPLVACRSADGGIAHCFAMRGSEGVDAKGPVSRKHFDEEFPYVRMESISCSDLLSHFRDRFPKEETAPGESGKTLNQTILEFADAYIRMRWSIFSPPTKT